MAGTLSIINNYTLENQGETYTGKQGAAIDGASEALEISVSGHHHGTSGTLASGSARTIWDEDDDFPTDIEYFWIWADQDFYVQVIGQTTNFIVKVEALVPFTLSANTMLAAASTTAISGSEPSVEAIDSIVIQNNSGSVMNYKYGVID